jgi:hypothetical protein
MRCDFLIAVMALGFFAGAADAQTSFAEAAPQPVPVQPPPMPFPPPVSIQPPPVPVQPPPVYVQPPPPAVYYNPTDEVWPVRADVGAPSQERLWIGVGLLLGWSERSRLPASLTVPATGTKIGFPTIQNDDSTAGIVIQGGVWLDTNQTHGVDASYLDLNDSYTQRDPRIIHTPIGQFHAASATVDSEYATADVNYRHPLYDADNLRVDGVIGYRFARLTDTARVGTIVANANFGAIRYHDRGDAQNDFNGGQLGLAGSYHMGPWTLNATGKIALGGVHSEASFHGASAAAILADAPGTIPSLSVNQFAVLPSVSLMLSRQIWGRSRIYVGYEFQYLSRTVRATDTFDALATGVPLKGDTGFWAQGVTLGWEWRY